MGKKKIDKSEIELFAKKTKDFEENAFRVNEELLEKYIKDDGKVHIAINLKDVESKDFIDDLEYRISKFRTTLPIVLDLYIDESSSITKEVVEYSLRTYYMNKFAEEKKEMKNDRLLSFLFLGLGIIVTSLSVALSIFDKQRVLSEVFGIFGWVLVASFMEKIAFDFPKMKRRCLQYVQLGTTEVNIIKEKN